MGLNISKPKSKLNSSLDRSINNVSQIQLNLTKAYKTIHPTFNALKIKKFTKSLSSSSAIFDAIQTLELHVFGKVNNGDSNLDYRAQLLADKATAPIG